MIKLTGNMSENVKNSKENITCDWKQVLIKSGIHSSHPAFDSLRMTHECLNKTLEETMKRASDSWRALEPEISTDVSLIFHYQKYPTAQMFIQALAYYTVGVNILENYGKESITTLDECQVLQKAFNCFAYGNIYENSLFGDNITKRALSLVDQYLELKPDDFMVEYLKYIMLYKSRCSVSGKTQLSDYEQNKLVIRRGEKMVQKLKSLKTGSEDRQVVLIDLYYSLGSRYSLTGQPERALDSFEKCYALDRSNYSALYGVAYHYKTFDAEKAKTLFEEYLKIAPSCDKQYPNAYYQLASMYLTEKNFDEAFRYSVLAEKFESQRLPFLQPVRLPQKEMLRCFRQMKNASNKAISL